MGSPHASTVTVVSIDNEVVSIAIPNTIRIEMVVRRFDINAPNSVLIMVL